MYRRLEFLEGMGERRVAREGKEEERKECRCKMM